MRGFVAIGEAMVELSSRVGADGESWRMAVAGDTLNTAWYARALLDGDWTVSYFTALGTDRYSRRIRDFITASGIETGLIRTVPDRRPGLYMIHQQDGDRHFTYWRDMSAARLLADDTDALRRAVLGADIVYFSGITLAILQADRRAALIAEVAAARAAGARVAFDPNIRPALWSGGDGLKASLAAAAAVSDVVLPTFGDELPLFGDKDLLATARRYCAYGAREVVVKNGAEATLVLHHGGQFESLPPRVGEVVDATGAGDSFNGAYLARRAMGDPPEAAVRMAHRVAGICIRHPGALVPPHTLAPEQVP
ncbi:sugar kinase [Aquamicrobium defluvii]|uniref:2-dehydro-3-deoxygluconokinase n=1 Tax=Aquamicrobium defluvii TaxID=69279 RepID=A0A011T5B6_9HYPH|nr:2-dehydro-3-deoxygluconokinase [Aquamicrobium defluvii]EZQ15789.1 2-dehydro-3-deoxygluconokinase [Halopseudomonas bauzanensis]TDR35916.1 2-keto-3-deoxygluconate kinase [Aquamicrobium defluvii]